MRKVSCAWRRLVPFQYKVVESGGVVGGRRAVNVVVIAKAGAAKRAGHEAGTNGGSDFERPVQVNLHATRGCIGLDRDRSDCGNTCRGTDGRTHRTGGP